MTTARYVLLLALCAAGAVIPACDGCSSAPKRPDGGSGGAGARDSGTDSPDTRPATGTGGKGGTVTCTDTGPRSAAPGDTCACNSDCTTGFCADGVCCDTACKDLCTSCDLPGSEGTCSAVPEGVKARNASECPVEGSATCGRDGTCDGSGACRLYVSGASCQTGMCDSDAVGGGHVCDGKGACKLGPAVICYPYGCSDGLCRDTCTTDADCSAGVKCMDNSCGKVPSGRACGKDGDCLSEHCADGVCCNDVCDGPCLSCKQTGFEGQCRPLGRGMAHPKCLVEKGTTCGMTGVCDGFGSCAVYSADTTCLSPSCSGNVANTPGTCDGNGVCEPPAQVPCDPYICLGTSCATKCTTDAQCVQPATCVNGSCGKKPMGAVCQAAGECTSNFCVDGICCESACQGACLTCGLSGSPGRCVNVAAGRDDPHKQCKDTGATSCGTDGKCDGNGGCRRYGTDAVCAPETCNGGAYTAPSNCSTGGQCLPPASNTCYPFACNGGRCFSVCTQSTQCVSPNTCVNGSCGLKPPGASCSSASECKAAPDGKQYCSQGVCCNSPCSGSCQACNVNGSAGTCSSVPTGTADKRCGTKDVSTCSTNGTCRNGNCDVYQTNNQCKGPSCSGPATSLAAAFCDGRGGACPGQGTVQCGAFTCNTATGLCLTSCDTDGQCVSPNLCINHTCGKLGNGAACTDASRCQSGNCIEGVCCNTSCSSATSGVCQSCKVSNHAGTCTPVPSGGAEVGGRCKATDRTTCGLDGTCDGAGKCRDWDTSTSCRNQSCPAGSTQTNAATCDGKGACSASSTKNCSPYACNVSGASCQTTCTSNAQCASGVACNTQTNKCGDKSALGTVCGLDADCMGGHCAKTNPSDATGICCDSSCTAGCQSCALPGKGGTCTSIAAGNPPRDPTASTCPTSAQSTCGNTGKCDGKGGCQLPADGTSCSDGSMCTLLDTCKSGTCVGSNPMTCPAGDPCKVAGICDPTTGACSTSNAKDGTMCDDGNKCTSGDACSAGVCKGSSSKTCAATDACHTAGTCDPGTGMCSNPVAPTGTNCDDSSNTCVSGRTCTAGVCSAGKTKTCPASDACHPAGMCVAATGMCPVADDGTKCDDPNNTCVSGRTCMAGVCSAGKTKTCPASDACHPAGMCVAATGMCPVADDGTNCDDPNNKCITGRMCMGGTCTAGTTTVCKADTCQVAGKCDQKTGTCPPTTNADNGTTCTGGICCAGMCTDPDAGTCSP